MLHKNAKDENEFHQYFQYESFHWESLKEKNYGIARFTDIKIFSHFKEKKKYSTNVVSENTVIPFSSKWCVLMSLNFFFHVFHFEICSNSFLLFFIQSVIYIQLIQLEWKTMLLCECEHQQTSFLFDIWECKHTDTANNNIIKAWRIKLNTILQKFYVSMNNFV